MSRQSAERKTNHRAGAEFLLFLIVSVVGVYSLGQGLTGLFEPGQGITLLWLAVTGVAMMILFAQMGRVQDSWPRRRNAKADQTINQQTTDEEIAQLPTQAEER
jgi:hypothetical protein